MTGAIVIEFLTAILVLLGAGFALVGSIGLARLPDIFTRLHGPTKATTLGVGAVVMASLLHFNAIQETLSLRELAIPLFLFITAPVSAHLVAKVARKARGDTAGGVGLPP
jgi:multicomponent K+:H+ antiporter subunit G